MAAKKTTREDWVEVMIPRNPAVQDPNYFVGINGVNYNLPRGKKSLVPPHVAEEIARSFEAEEKMYEAQAEMQAKAGQQ